MYRQKTSGFDKKIGLKWKMIMEIDLSKRDKSDYLIKDKSFSRQNRRHYWSVK
jgi:hypothetical protein